MLFQDLVHIIQEKKDTTQGKELFSKYKLKGNFLNENTGIQKVNHLRALKSKKNINSQKFENF